MFAERSVRAVRHVNFLFSSRPDGLFLSAKTTQRRYASIPIRRVPSGPDQPNQDFRGAIPKLEQPDDQFYKYYLTFQSHKRRDNHITPSPWTQFINSGPSLVPALQRDPISVLDSDTEDLDLVRSCLEHFIAMTREKSPSKQEERVHYQQVKPGSRALLWLISGDGFHKHDLGLNPKFSQVVVHCIAAENGTEALWTWLFVDEVPHFAASWRIDEQIAWRGSVLRSLMESATFWANDITKGLETALRLFQRAINLGHKRRNGGPPNVPLYPAGIWLHKQLCWYESHSVSLPLLRRFAQTFAIWSSDPDERRFKTSRLFLAVDPLQSYHFFRDCDAITEPSLWIQDFFNPTDGKSANLAFFALVRTAQALQKANAPTEAKWILDFGRRRLPNLFSQRPHEHTTTNHSALRTHRLLASASQIAEGLPVNQDGSAFATERRRQMDEAMVRHNAEERQHTKMLREAGARESQRAK